MEVALHQPETRTKRDQGGVFFPDPGRAYYYHYFCYYYFCYYYYYHHIQDPQQVELRLTGSAVSTRIVIIVVMSVERLA